MLGLGQVGCQLSLTGPRLMNPCRQPGSGIWPDHHLKLPRVLTVLSLGFLPNLDIPLLPTHLTHTPCAVLCVLGRSVVSPALHFIFRMVLSLHLICVPTLLPLPGTTSSPSPGEHPFNPLRLSSGPITSSGGVSADNPSPHWPPHGSPYCSPGQGDGSGLTEVCLCHRNKLQDTETQDILFILVPLAPSSQPSLNQG